MRIAVIGAGAMGSIYGGHLSLENEVYLVDTNADVVRTINEKGITEGKLLHNYADFRAFGIVKEGEHFSAVLIPKKRFGLSVKVFFPEGSGEAIVDQLGAHLPMEEIKQDCFASFGFRNKIL